MRKLACALALAGLLAMSLAACGQPKPVTLLAASDLHYVGDEVTDGGELFQMLVEFGDGRQLDYIVPITDAFISEALAQKPTAVILTGDLTLNGEKNSHEQLAARLKALTDAGIGVYVLPGNHDINNYAAYAYIKDGREEIEHVTPEEFTQIYAHCGFEAAASRDTASLSYMAKLSKEAWLFMLDAEQYADHVPAMPYLVGGKLQDETYVWLEEQLAACQKAGAVPVIGLHQNLTDHTPRFSNGYTLFENDRLGELLQTYGARLLFSGHLHIQDISLWQSETGEGPGVYDIASGSLSVWPYQYGQLTVTPSTKKEGGSLAYQTKATDVTAWAAAQSLADPNYTDFSAFGREQFGHNSTTRSTERMLDTLGEKNGAALLRVMAHLNPLYFAGQLTKEEAEAVRQSEDYKRVKAACEKRSDNPLAYIDSMLESGGKQNLQLTIELPLG